SNTQIIDNQNGTRSGNTLIGIDLADVKHIYIGSFGDHPLNEGLRNNIITKISASGRLNVVTDLNNADAVLKGSIMQDNHISVKLINRPGIVLWAKDIDINSKADFVESAATTITSQLLKDINEARPES
ncbi:MAG: hypothetical protein AB1489_43310, partial [Acidobacteriota bacterium]